MSTFDREKLRDIFVNLDKTRETNNKYERLKKELDQEMNSYN